MIRKNFSTKIEKDDFLSSCDKASFNLYITVNGYQGISSQGLTKDELLEIRNVIDEFLIKIQRYETIEVK